MAKQKSLRKIFELIIIYCYNVARDNAPCFSLSGPNHLQLKFNPKMQDVKCALDLNCELRVIRFFHPPQKNQIHMSMNHIFFNAYDSMRNEKEGHMRENSRNILAQKKGKNDSLDGGVRKRAETEGKECCKKKEGTGGCGAPQCKRRIKQFNFFNWLSNVTNLVLSNGSEHLRNVIQWH